MENTPPAVWDDLQIEYHRVRKPDGQVHIEGTVVLHNITYRFYLNQQSRTNSDGSKTYINSMRGEITVSSRRDGFKLQKKIVTDAETGDEIHPQDNVVRYQCYIDSTKNEDIKMNLLEDILNLRRKHFKVIEADLDQVPLDLLSPTRAVNHYGKVYLNHRHVKTGKRAPKEATIDKNFEKLEKLAILLGGTAMANVTYTELLSAYQRLGKSAAAIFKMGHDFWEYCRNRGLYHGPNPFDDFYRLADKMNEAPEDVRRRAMRPRALPEAVEARFAQYCEDLAVPTAKDLGLILAHDGFTAATATSVLEGAVTRDTIAPGSVCVKLEKRDNTGATHKYTRPLSPPAADKTRKFLDASSRVPGEKESPPLLRDGERKLSSKALTAYSRTQLLALGMDEREMRADADTICGVGVDLLQRNFKHWLQYHCGLARDHGAVNFMQMLSLHDATSDHYRSLTCMDGQQYLLAAMRRDKRFCPKPETADISINHDDQTGITSITVPAADPRRFTEVEFELKLGEGDWIELMSPVFMTVTIEVIEYE